MELLCTLQRTGLFRRLTHARTVSNHCLTGDPKSRALEETRRYKGDTKVVLAQIQKASNQACCPSMMWDLGVDGGLLRPRTRLARLPYSSLPAIIAALYRGRPGQHRDRVPLPKHLSPFPLPRRNGRHFAEISPPVTTWEHTSSIRL